LIENAKSGERAEKPWWKEIFEYYLRESLKIQKEGLPLKIYALLNNQKMHSQPFMEPLSIEEAPQDWEPVEESRWAKNDNRFSVFLIPATDAEIRDALHDFYKKYSFFREEAGGDLDPLFFGTDVEGLARIPYSEIALLEFAPAPGAKGFKVSALGEWRTGSGEAVKLVKVLK